MRARRVIGRAAAALVAVAAVSVLSAGPVSADGREPEVPPTGGGVDENGNPIVVAGDPGTDDDEDTTPGDEGDTPVCWWEVIIADDRDYPFYADDGTAIYSRTGRWLRQYCDGEVVTTGGWYWSVPEGGIVIPGDLAQEAAESVPIGAPGIGTSPSSGRLVVRVPTWMWVDAGWWEPYSATATAGRVSATVTATPVRAVWSTGDGATVVCGAGVTWRPGLAEDATDCAHTYTSSSSGGGYELSVEVEIELAWTSNVGQSGTLDPITRTGTQTVHVGEVQAVGTR